VLDRTAWHAERRTGIGSTDTAKILGLSKRGTALTVWREKVSPESDNPDADMSLPAWLGLRLQGVVAELYQQASGVTLRADNRTHRYRPWPILYTHLDYRAKGARWLVVECKTRAYMTGWGEAGSAVVPVDVWVQCQHELLVTGADRVHVAVLFGHHTFRVYDIERHPEFHGQMLERLPVWWERHVIGGEEPPATGHALDRQAVTALHPHPTEPLRSTTPRQDELIADLLLARANERQAKAAKEELENRVRQMIGDASGLIGAWGDITLGEPGTKTDWRRLADSYRKAADQLLTLVPDNPDAALIATQLPVLEGLYTKRDETRRISYHITGGTDDQNTSAAS
jgi:predicted phage-related endonuclease